MIATLPIAVPEGFRQRFLEDGWRGIERYYGARTELMMKWMDLCGGLGQLKVERRAYLLQQAEAARVSVAGDHPARVGRAA